ADLVLKAGGAPDGGVDAGGSGSSGSGGSGVSPSGSNGCSASSGRDVSWLALVLMLLMARRLARASGLPL
ncbi:MAG: hypothetical protein WBM47_15420, partial [Polyangiales bacterium]